MGIALFAVYAAAMLAVAGSFGKGKADELSFFLNKRTGSAALVAFSIVASCVGASATMGMVGLAFTVGTPAFWWLGSGAAGLSVLTVLLARRVRSSRAYTLPEMLEAHLGSHVRRLASAIIVVAWTAILAAQFTALTQILAALTGGAISLAAAVCTRQVAEGISRDKRPLMHGPTFMANPLACRAALAGLDLLRASPWAEQVQAMQDTLEAGLAGCRKQARVHDVRVLGAIGVVVMAQPVNAVRLRTYFAEQHEVWIRPFNRLIYLMPPYAVTAGEVARLCLAIREAIEGEEWV
jgi:hypothetical protein